MIRKTILLITLIVLTTFTTILLINKNKKDLDVISAIYPLIYNQKDINEKLDKISNDKNYSFDNAYIQLNPYKISPLSGIIIFQTKEDKEVKVYINDKLFTTMEKSTKHIIPIYGLYEDYDNIVKIVIDNNSKEYHFKTEKSNIKYPVEVTKKSDKLSEDLYFTAGSMISGLTAWDSEGKLRFYLTEMVKMDVEWLSNGHFIVGTDQGNDLDGYAATDRYLAFVEMDYMGKIYNYYKVTNGFDFESQILSNGNYLIGGGNSAIYFTNQIVYEYNPKENKVVSSIDVTDIIRNIDPNFDKAKSGQAMGKNGFYYDDKTKEIVISMRQLNALISINYETKQINWVLTNKDNKYFNKELWKNYLLDSDITPKGQHSPQILGNGLYAYFDNNYDRVNTPTKVIDYKNKYSEAIIFKVDNKKATTIWSSSKIYNKYFTQKYGYFRVLDNGNKLIDFGWILHDNYFNDTNTFQDAEGNVDVTYSVYSELDENDNVLFEAKCEEGKYRIFKHNIYNDNTSNLNLSLNIYNNFSEDNYEEIKVDKKVLEEANTFDNYFEFTENSFYTNYPIQEQDSIELIFVNNNKSYLYNYKDSKSTTINKTFYLKLPNNTYELYIKINDILYKTNKKYLFDN